MHKILSAVTLLSFLVYQATITYLSATKAISFNFAYASVSLALVVAAAFFSYLAHIEVPDMRTEVKKMLDVRDQEFAQLKSELSKFTITKTTGRVDDFRF